MFQNNLKIALRTLRKNKVYSIITLVGLTAGIAASLLIYRMVSYEMSFNKNFEKYDRIYRVIHEEVEADGTVELGSCTPIPAMDAMEETVSQFAAMSRAREVWATLALPDPNGGPPLKKFKMENAETAFIVEPAFSDIFGLKWIAGDAATALEAPSSIVLTERWVSKFFNSAEEAMGQVIIIDNLVPMTVKGVIADLPSNCDFNFPFLFSWETQKKYPDHFFYSEHWGSCSSNNQVFALLNDTSQKEGANAILAKVGEEEYTDRSTGETRRHLLQPLSDLHFNEEVGNSGTHRISKSRLQVLSGIGILILIMACFNFINLATAQSSLRAKEVGVRKTLGGQRGQLVFQFMSETGIIVILAVVFGANLAAIGAPLLKHISDVPDAWPFFSDPNVWAFLGAVAVAVTLLAGLYPSLALASFKPVTAIRNRVSQGVFGGAAIRKSLVVLQFIIAQGLIVGTLVTLSQLDFIQSRDLGFSKDLIYTFNVGIDSSALVRQSGLKNELLQIPTVESVSFSSDKPLSGNTWAQNFRYASRPEDEHYSITTKFCDADYQKTYGMEMLVGKWYEPSDTIKDGVVNMTLLRKLGVNDPNEAVGEFIRLGGSQPVRITGVVEDFHAYSLHDETLPLLLTTLKDYYWDAAVKIRPDDVAGSIAAIQSSFDKVMPEQVFEGRFIDEHIARFYEDDNRLASTCKGFGLLAVLISCLGLFGLATHAAQQRVKEIGVRKVLGATTGSIIGLLSKDFLKLVLVALFIASPLAYYFMENWLQDFAYRIDIQWWVFGLAGLLAVLVAFFTVSFQSVRAALANPVESLRSE